MGAVPAACRADHRPLGELVVETALPYWAHSNGRPDMRVPSERHTQVATSCMCQSYLLQFGSAAVAALGGCRDP